MFERRSDPLLARAKFFKRLINSLLLAMVVVVVGLSTGTWGYHYFESLPWLDALLNASMILTGMGPVDRVLTSAGKLFATVYALFSGIVFLTTVGILVVPLAHRFFHRFHVE